MELVDICNWLKTNKLSLSLEEGMYMIFHTLQTSTQLQVKIDNNTPIDRVYNFNRLCLTINENLNWKSHINKMANKISKSIN